VNVDEVETYGIDLDFAVLLAERWNLNLALTWNKAEFSDAVGVPCTSGEPVPEEDWSYNTCDLTGERAGKLPEWSSVVSTEYWLPVGSGDTEMYFRGLLNAESEYYSQALGEDLDSYTALDLVVGARTGSGKWDINLWVKNVTDETALLKAIRLPSVPDYENGGSVETGLNHVERQLAPRTVGATLRLNF
jgi:iron complex outermembrane receptor protein